MNPGALAATWTTPAGASSIDASNGLAMFGRLAPANQAFDFGSSTSSGRCGLADVAPLLLR
jgi:hypothetical protein